MKFQMALIIVALHCGPALCIELPDETAIAPLIHDLTSEKPEVRETAAASLRKVSAQKVMEQARDYWKSKLALIKQGMTSAEVHRLLPPFPPQSQTSRFSGGGGTTEIYRLDNHWEVTVFYLTTPDTVHPEPPVLIKREMPVRVLAPMNFTGKWTSYYTNGEKAYDIEFKEGKHDGLFISYYDNGHKAVEQQFSSGQIFGQEKGWHPNGEPAYEGQYMDGKQAGKWIWWYANGTKQSEMNYKNGELVGQGLRWDENGKQ